MGGNVSGSPFLVKSRSAKLVASLLIGVETVLLFSLQMVKLNLDIITFEKQTIFLTEN